MKYAIKAIFLALKEFDLISAWKLFINIGTNARISNEVFFLLEELEKEEHK